MICPECKVSGNRSKVYINRAGVSTDVAYQPYYDEEGSYHHHDNNLFTQTWVCSENHSGVIVRASECWCGWVGHGENIRVDAPALPVGADDDKASDPHRLDAALPSQG